KMKKLTFYIIFFLTGFSLFAQEKFELNASVKAGLFFPPNKDNNEYFPENALSPGIGVGLQYNIFEKTSISLGIEGNYLNPSMIDYQNNQIDPLWHSVNIPFRIKQFVGPHIMLVGGAKLVRQIKGYWDSQLSVYRGQQQIPEYSWELGAGWKFNKLSLFLIYNRGFGPFEKIIKTNPNSYFPVELIHQEIYLKVQYPLWKF
ncbi:MAG: hypothetical protein ACP5D9_10700, partial [Mariniphaga sp.]